MRPEKVSRELSGAVAEEQKRQAIDAAKKKAVAQQADYDTFKKMVSVAHLKPLHALSSHGSKGCCMPAWQLDPSIITHSSKNAGAAGQAPCSSSSDDTQHTHVSGLQQSQEQAAAAAAAAAVGQPVLPCTSQEFAREWRRHCPTAAEKYRLLQQCGPARLAQVFKVEVDSILLGQMLQAMQQQCSRQPAHAQQQQQQQQQQAVDACPGDVMAAAAAGAEKAAAGPTEAARVEEAVLVVRLLQSLTGAGRFDLNVRLMDRPSKAAAAELCRQLHGLLAHAATQADCSSSGPGSSAGSCAGGGTSDGQSAISAAALAGLQAVMLKLHV